MTRAPEGRHSRSRYLFHPLEISFELLLLVVVLLPLLLHVGDLGGDGILVTLTRLVRLDTLRNVTGLKLGIGQREVVYGQSDSRKK